MKFRFLFCIALLGISVGIRAQQNYDTRFTVLPIADQHLKTVGDVLKYIARRVTYWEADLDTASMWHYPVETLMSRAGDCKDYSSLTVQILDEIGISANFIGAEIIDTKSGQTSNHALIRVGKEYFEPQNQDGTVSYTITRVFWDWDYKTMKKKILEIRKNGAAEL